MSASVTMRAYRKVTGVKTCHSPTMFGGVGYWLFGGLKSFSCYSLRYCCTGSSVIPAFRFRSVYHLLSVLLLGLGYVLKRPTLSDLSTASWR